MIDTHCHLTFNGLRERLDEVLRDAASRGVHGAITVSTTTRSALDNLAIANAHRNVWCTAGVHPLHSDEPIDWDTMIAVANEPRCVAWGELGLDHHYREPARDLQLRVLREQLTVIERSGVERPVVVHCRDAFDALLPIFQASSLPPDRFVFHCFTGGPQEARAVLDFGAWISFTGIVTFRNAREIQEACRLVPDDRIMIETDAPFLTPEPHRKIRPNEPQYAWDTAQFVARLRETDWNEFHDQINANARRFFGLPDHAAS
ncbi:MAG: TatD family hydrolase [Phycisphaerales bacterium]